MCGGASISRDNRALFPCHIGKRINIPRVCFQAALWNKSQAVVASPGSPVPRNCLFPFHESPAPGGTSEIPCGARGLLRAGCAVPPWTSGAELLHIHRELSLALVSVGIQEPPGHLCSPESPGHLVLWSVLGLPSKAQVQQHL